MSRNYNYIMENRATVLTRLEMNDEFERVSGFYQNKEGVFQKKTCEFKIMVGSKQEASCTFDLSTQLGNKNKPIDIKMAGNFIIKVQFKIIPYT